MDFFACCFSVSMLQYLNQVFLVSQTATVGHSCSLLSGRFAEMYWAEDVYGFRIGMRIYILSVSAAGKPLLCVSSFCFRWSMMLLG